MLRYYCQADGGQWNVEVWQESYLPAECGANAVVHGEELQSVCVTADGCGIMIVPLSSLFDRPQGLTYTKRKDKA